MNEKISGGEKSETIGKKSVTRNSGKFALPSGRKRQ